MEKLNRDVQEKQAEAKVMCKNLDIILTEKMELIDENKRLKVKRLIKEVTQILDRESVSESSIGRLCIACTYGC